MKGNLISQFQGKTILEVELEALSEELEEILSVAEDLREKRWIDTASGVTLDGIGDIVGQPRIILDSVPLEFFGFYGQPSALGFGIGKFRDSGERYTTSRTVEDAEYRFLLWAKVFKNVSQGTTEDTIQSLKYIFGVENVVVEDAGNAKISIAIGRKLTQAETLLAQSYNLMIRAGGVGIKSVVQFDENNYFGFLGQKGAKGFGRGKFADEVIL